MADLLSQVKREIDARLTELRPVVDEVRRLERAREALGRANRAGRKKRGGNAVVRKSARMSKGRAESWTVVCSRFSPTIRGRSPQPLRC
jgi:hypothetical protein